MKQVGLNQHPLPALQELRKESVAAEAITLGDRTGRRGAVSLCQVAGAHSAPPPRGGKSHPGEVLVSGRQLARGTGYICM